jgi:hypothetical protein
MRSIYKCTPMIKRFPTFIIIFLCSIAGLSGCNLPERQAAHIPIQPGTSLVETTPTPTGLCSNPYFPIAVGDQWEYSGNNSLIGAYTRTDNVTSTNTTSFTLATSVGNVIYSAIFDCSSTGLTAQNPIQQYAGALLSSPDAPVRVNMTSNTGTSLPATIITGDTWQQTTDWQATSPRLNINGRFVFDYSAAGYEIVTVPAGQFNALRVDATIHVEVTSLHVPVGTFTSTSWWAAEVGLVKSEGTSHVTGVDFTDSMQLTKFIPLAINSSNPSN